MAWQYVKGSAKDFEGAPDWATVLFGSNDEDVFGYAEKWEKDARYVYGRHVEGRLEGWLNSGVVLAQRQPVESWNGAGLPPVCIDIEYRHKGADNWSYTGWLTGRVVWFGNAEFCVVNSYGKAKVANIGEWDFRPLRTEADKKRDEACRVISHIIDEDRNFQFDAKKIYDAIASGKIPGVKLED